MRKIVDLLQLNSLALSLFGVGIFGVAAWIVKKIAGVFRRVAFVFESLKEADLALLHYRIYITCTEMLEKGFATVEELDNLEYFWSAYAALGGNGTGEKLYKDVKRLPIQKGGEANGLF